MINLTLSTEIATQIAAESPTFGGELVKALALAQPIAIPIARDAAGVAEMAGDNRLAKIKAIREWAEAKGIPALATTTGAREFYEHVQNVGKI